VRNVTVVVRFQTFIQIFREADVEMFRAVFTSENIDVEEFHLACRVEALGTLRLGGCRPPSCSALGRGILRSTQCSERRMVRGAGFEPVESRSFIKQFAE
jgi:hypothetical protein